MSKAARRFAMIGAVLTIIGGVGIYAMRSGDTDVADASAPKQGSPMVEVRVPSELSAKAQTGKRGFDARCAECHGPNASGQEGVAPPLIHKIYEPSHHGDMSFLLAAKNGVRAHHWSFGNMPKVEGLTDAEVAYITLYVRELQRENGIQ